jgi:hypothetical protein
MSDTLTVNDLYVTSDEPRILDLRIAERLEMADVHDIRRTIEANRPELERYGEISGRRPEIRGRGRRPSTEFLLNEPQTLLICMFSRTEKAAEVRQEVVQVYMAFRNGTAGPEAPTAGDLKMIDPPTPWRASKTTKLHVNEVQMMVALEHVERSLLIARGDLYDATLKQQQDKEKSNIAYALLRRTQLTNEDIGEDAGLHPAFVEYLRQTMA